MDSGVPKGAQRIEGSLTKWIIPSSCGMESYMVDLTTNGGIGSCTCKDFRTRRWVRIKDSGCDAITASHSMRCKHIHQAINHMLKHMSET